jgi:hypothetical protein
MLDMDKPDIIALYQPGSWTKPRRVVA